MAMMKIKNTLIRSQVLVTFFEAWVYNVAIYLSYHNRNIDGFFPCRVAGRVIIMQFYISRPFRQIGKINTCSKGYRPRGHPVGGSRTVRFEHMFLVRTEYVHRDIAFEEIIILDGAGDGHLAGNT